MPRHTRPTSGYQRHLAVYWAIALAAVTTLTFINPPNATAGDRGAGPPVPEDWSPPTTPFEGANAAVIQVKGLIYGYTLESLKQGIDQAVDEGASLIVIELDTTGGLVDSALKISKYLKSLNVPTVAWINPQAYSAGIMIAAACNKIVMAPASATGDCAPIIPGVSLSPTERAKALSPILEEFRDSAQAHGYDFALFHAMCVLGVEVYQIENPQTGRRVLVNQADYAVMVQGTPVEDAVPTPSDEADQVGAATVSIATEADREQWELVRRVHDGKTLLTLNQKRALDVGLSWATIRDRDELSEHLKSASMTSVGHSRVALVTYWLTLPWVRGLLIVAMLVGAYTELQAPGLGVAGLVSLAALVVLLVAPFLVGLAQAWHVLLFLLGLTLLLIEVFVIPGFGLIGVAGVIAMFTGLVLMVVPSTGHGPIPMPAPEMGQRLQDSLMYTLVGILGSAAAFYYITKYFGSIPVLNKLVLKAPGSRDTDRHISGDEAVGGGHVHTGALGRVVTKLRPSGRAQIDGRLVDVMSVGEWIEPGKPVRVVEVHGNRIVVEAAPSDPPPSG